MPVNRESLTELIAIGDANEGEIIYRSYKRWDKALIAVLLITSRYGFLAPFVRVQDLP